MTSNPSVPAVPPIPPVGPDDSGPGSGSGTDADPRADDLDVRSVLEGGKTADDGEPVGRADLDADVRRSRGE